MINLEEAEQILSDFEEETEQQNLGQLESITSPELRYKNFKSVDQTPEILFEVRISNQISLNDSH